MLSAKVIRSKARNYPAEFNRLNTKFLREAAIHLQGQVKQKIRQDKIVDTGRLRGSIDSKSNSETATVFTNVEYASYVEYGTRKMSARPYMRPTLDTNRKFLIREYLKQFRGVFSGR